MKRSDFLRPGIGLPKCRANINKVFSRFFGSVLRKSFPVSKSSLICSLARILVVNAYQAPSQECWLLIIAQIQTGAWIGKRFLLLSVDILQSMQKITHLKHLLLSLVHPLPDGQPNLPMRCHQLRCRVRPRQRYSQSGSRLFGLSEN